MNDPTLTLHADSIALFQDGLAAVMRGDLDAYESFREHQMEIERAWRAAMLERYPRREHPTEVE